MKNEKKLLQLLQFRQYFPLGGTQAITANIRVIAANDSSPGKAGGFGNVSRSKRQVRNRFAAP